MSSPVVFGVDWAKPGEEYTVVGRFTQGVISSVSTFGPIHSHESKWRYERRVRLV